MNARHVRVGHVYRWGSGYWRVVGRRGGRLHIEKVEQTVGATGAVAWVPTGARELRPPGELRPL